MNSLIQIGIILAGAVTLLAVQYFLRKTFAARLLTAGFVLVLLLIPPVPWQTAFAIAERLSPNPSAGNAVHLSFVADHETPPDRPVGPMPDSRVATSVLLPITVTGVPDEAILYGESSTARIVTQDENKSVLVRDQMGLPTLRTHRVDPNKPFTYVIAVPGDIYVRIADQPVRLEIDYQLTLLKLADMQTLPATGGDQRSASLGWCGTRLRGATGDITLGCVSAAPPSCISIDLVVFAHRRAESSERLLRTAGLLAAPARLRTRRAQPLHRTTPVWSSGRRGSVSGEGAHASPITGDGEAV